VKLTDVLAFGVLKGIEIGSVETALWDWASADSRLVDFLRGGEGSNQEQCSD